MVSPAFWLQGVGPLSFLQENVIWAVVGFRYMEHGPSGSRDFEAIEERCKTETRDTFPQLYGIYWYGLNLLKDSLDLLIREQTEEEDLYVKVLLILSNRTIHHLESMRILMEAGLYGDAFALVRSCTSDLAMMQYLRLRPDLVEQFLNEGQDDYAKNTNGFRNNFSEGAVNRALDEAGIFTLHNVFSNLSKFSHASAFGSQVFGTPGDAPGKYHMNYGPRFTPTLALAVSSFIVAGHFDLLDNILIYRRSKGAPTKEWASLEEDFEVLDTRVTVYGNASKKTLDDITALINNGITPAVPDTDD